MKRAICLALIGVLTTLACAAKEPFRKEDTIEASATIEAIDPATRMFVVNGPAGVSVIAAGPEVRNFDQMKVGDKVKMTYKAAIAAKISKIAKISDKTARAMIAGAIATAATGGALARIGAASAMRIAAAIAGARL